MQEDGNTSQKELQSLSYCLEETHLLTRVPKDDFILQEKKSNLLQ